MEFIAAGAHKPDPPAFNAAQLLANNAHHSAPVIAAKKLLRPVTGRSLDLHRHINLTPHPAHLGLRLRRICA